MPAFHKDGLWATVETAAPVHRDPPDQNRAPRFYLARYFALTGLAAFLVVAAALLYFARQEGKFFDQVQKDQLLRLKQSQESFARQQEEAARRDLLKIHETESLNLARLLANTLWPGYFAPFMAQAQQVSVARCRAIADTRDGGGKLVPPPEKKPCYEEIGKKIMGLPGFRALDAAVFRTMKKSTVFKIKVFDLRGITAYSSEHAQIGEDKRDNAGWQSAAAGKPASELTFRDRFSAFEGVVEKRNLISIYLPVLDPGGESIVGVFEAYSDVTPLLDQMRATSREIRRLGAEQQQRAEQMAAANQVIVDRNANLLIATVIGLLMLLYCSMFLIVLNGQRIIDRQNKEHALADEAQREAAEQLHSFVEQSIAGIYIMQDGKFAYVNPRFAEILGYGSAQEMIGQDGMTLPAAKDRAVVAENIRRRLAGEVQSVNYAFTAVRKDGSTVEIGVHGSRATYRGRPAIIGLMQDITERARAEQQLHQSEERYRALFERSLDCIFLTDLEGNFLDANHAALDLLGYRRDEIPALSFRTLLDPVDLPRAHAALQEVIRTGSQREANEYTLRHKDGRQVVVESKTALVYEEGRPGAILGIARDITRRKQAQRELEYQRIMLLTQQETSPDAILVVDGSARIISYNRRFLELWGISEEMARAGDDELALQSVVGRMQNPEEFLKKIKYLYENRAEKSHDELQLKDGGIIDRHSAPVTGAGGEYYGRIWYFRDITERRRAEAALHENRERLRLLIEHAPAALAMFDREMRYLTASRRWIDDYFLGDRDIIGRTHYEIFPEIPARWKDIHRRGLAGEVIKADADRFERLDGTVQLLRWEVRPWHGGDGTIGGIIIFTEDITERERAEAALSQSEQRFRAMIEQSISGFYMIQDGTFTYVNARFAEIFGYASPEEIVGKSPSELVAPRDRATVAENIRRRIAGEIKSLSYTFSGARKDGTEFDVGVHGSLATHDGRPAVIGLLQDISERKHAEDEIKRYVARLEQAMQSTINVVATIGELRDPYTHGHERRVGEIAAAIGAELGLDDNQVEGIRIAGYLHDVGKIAVPAEILSKPGKLTKAEYDLVKDHAQQSYEILKSVPFPWPVAETAWQHHERLDGSGYPRGLKGEEIILEARILAVADTLEAMSSHRPYRPGLGIDKALAEIEKGRGTLFCPQAADACLRLFRDKAYAMPA